MELKQGHSQEIVSHNISEMIKSGKKPKEAIASALANARRYKRSASGGFVNEDGNIDEEYKEIYEPSDEQNESQLLPLALAEKPDFDDDMSDSTEDRLIPSALDNSVMEAIKLKKMKRKFI